MKLDLAIGTVEEVETLGEGVTNIWLGVLVHCLYCRILQLTVRH